MYIYVIIGYTIERGDFALKRATKATVKRLEKLAFYDSCYGAPAILLREVEQAGIDLSVLGDCQKYGCMDEYNESWGYNGGRAFYSCSGLAFRPDKDGNSGNVIRGLQCKYPDLVSYSQTHDLNLAVVSDINKLVKKMLENEGF